MSEFTIELELTGLKIKIHGQREDVPMAINNVGQQFASLLQPMANITGVRFSFYNASVISSTDAACKDSAGETI